MIGINEQCEICRHLNKDHDDGQLFFDCDVSCLLEEDEKRDCPDWEEDRWWEDECE